MRIPIYQIDAFTKEQFKGNPAAVCPLAEWIKRDNYITLEWGIKSGYIKGDYFHEKARQ
jgi:hypothetical protein